MRCIARKNRVTGILKQAGFFHDSDFPALPVRVIIKTGKLREETLSRYDDEHQQCKTVPVEPTDPVAVEVGTLNPLKDKGVAAAYLVMLLCVLFAALFKSCGYILCAVVLSMIIMFLIGKRNWVQMILVSVLVPLLMWLVFYKVLTVNIPLGPLNFLRTLVDMI